MNPDITPLPIRNSYWVISERFRAGGYPGSSLESEARGKLQWLLLEQANFFLDLTAIGESDLVPYQQFLYEEAAQMQTAVAYHRLPIVDFSTPSKERMVEILNTIDNALSQGQNIYLHCYGGKGRTGMVVGCYLARHGMRGEKALEAIKELRRNILDVSGNSPETEAQKRMVLEWTTGK